MREGGDNHSISEEFKHGRKAGEEQQRKKAMKSISTIPVGLERRKRSGEQEFN